VSWVEVPSPPEDGELVSVDAAGTVVVVGRAGGSWFAVDGWCTHAECPLGDGWLEDGALRCACHAALFDLGTGAVLEGPAEEPLVTYPVRVADGRVEVDVP
jgi:nitrite reductase/ring-hydroxylating ferredoxin subunit